MKSADEVESYIAALIEEISLGQVRASDVGGADELIADLGLDSLDYATVLLGCERWLGTRVREDGVDWAGIRTVSELAAFLCAHQGR